MGQPQDNKNIPMRSGGFILVLLSAESAGMARNPKNLKNRKPFANPGNTRLNLVHIRDNRNRIKQSDTTRPFFTARILTLTPQLVPQSQKIIQ